MSPSPTPSSRPLVESAASASPVYVYLAGVGTVGTALLRQLADRSGSSPRLQLLGACTSRRAIWANEGLSPRTLPSHLDDAASFTWSSLVDRLTQDAPRPVVFIDATGSPEVANLYDRFLRAGLHVVTPSKLANTQSQAEFDRLHSIARENGVVYRYETTVGAGLPVVQTVRDLVDTGDCIRTIRGAVSGTLTFLFSALRNDASFSEAVKTAIDRGYAEPDVRDDLSGEDVARKFLILARTAGYSIEREAVHVESLVPTPLAGDSLDDFLSRLHTVDEHWHHRVRAAAAEGTVLQYVGDLSTDGVDVGVRRVSTDSAFGRLEGQNNLFEIQTDRYAECPLTVRGPGAGPEVTAAGVLSDVLTVARMGTNGRS